MTSLKKILLWTSILGFPIKYVLRLPFGVAEEYLLDFIKNNIDKKWGIIMPVVQNVALFIWANIVPFVISLIIVCIVYWLGTKENRPLPLEDYTVGLSDFYATGTRVRNEGMAVPNIEDVPGWVIQAEKWKNDLLKYINKTDRIGRGLKTIGWMDAKVKLTGLNEEHTRKLNITEVLLERVYERIKHNEGILEDIKYGKEKKI